MLWTTCSNIPIKISIISNFGCPHKCWYCIWKGHPLENVNLPMDWKKLRKFLTENKEQKKFSVSGGGDCLYRFDEHREWWDRIFSIANELNMSIDVHSRTIFRNDMFWKKINRCVFSVDLLDSDNREYLKYLSKYTKLRFTHLVTDKTTFEMIDDFLNYQKELNCQFTIKELVGYSDNGMYCKIREKYNSIFHLDNGDYNIYYMPDNTIHKTFLF